MDRPAIPDDIKRQVRQRCGFGCVICGSPIYDYDHIIDYSKVLEHTADNITLLCDKHHRRKTKKLLPVESIIQHNKNPRNLISNTSDPEYLPYSGQDVTLSVGGTSLSYQKLESGTHFFPFVIDGLPIISFANRDDMIVVNATFHDQSGQVCFQIVENELTYNVSQWDVEWVGKVLTIRTASRKILLKIEFSPPGLISILRADLRYNGVELDIGEDYIFCRNNSMFLSQGKVSGHQYAFAIGSNPPKGGSGFVVEVNRTSFDREKANQHLREFLKNKTKTRKPRSVRRHLLGTVSTLALIPYGSF